MNTVDEINHEDERDELSKSTLMFNRGFMVTIVNNDGSLLFRPHMVSNFSIDGKKIFITLYDKLQLPSVEEEIDKLSSGFWFMKPTVSIVLMRLDPRNVEIYRVEYKKCKLQTYHGKNFTYKSNELHQWYLEFSFKEKSIINKCPNDYIKEGYNTNSSLNEAVTEYKQNRHKRYTKKELAILKNSNKMLDDAAEKVRDNNKLTQKQKDDKITEINDAKMENETMANKYFGETLKGFNFDEIEKSIEKQIAKLENNMNK